MRNLIRGLTAALLLATLPLAADAGVFVSINIAPPVLPVYAPPPVPGPGYLWTPGYWAWADGGYYWVPGTWVLAPAPGLLWTPGYWGFADGIYLWHAGYWGPHVGFYGGVNYGFGYTGVGFHGGYWRGGAFVIDRVAFAAPAPLNRVCFNGAGGIVAHASPEELRFAHERHLEASEMQRHNEQMAARDNTMRASWNHGRPPVAATARPGVFYGQGVVAARSGSEPPAAFARNSALEHGAVTAHGMPGAPAHGSPANRGGFPGEIRAGSANRAPASPPQHAQPPADHGAYPGAPRGAAPNASHGSNPGAARAGGTRPEGGAHGPEQGHGGGERGDRGGDRGGRDRPR